MNKNFRYAQPEPDSSAQVVGYDEQGRRRIRLKVPKKVHKNPESTYLPSSESYPLRPAQMVLDSSNADPVRPPQKTNNQKNESDYSYSYTPIDYSYSSAQYSNEKSNEAPSTTCSYQTLASSVSGTVPSYTTFSYYSNTGSYSSTQSQQGNTQTTAVSGPNTYTKIRVKVKKNKDGTKTIIGPAKGGVAKPVYTREDPHYRAPELPPHTQNERYVRGLTSISSEDPEKNSAVLDLDLKINNAVPYQDEINRHFFNAVPKKAPQIGDGADALPENFRVSIPYNSRFMDANDTTMIDSTTLDTMTTESTQLDSFRTVVSRDMPSYWDQNKDAEPARAKLFIQDNADYIDNDEIENFRREEERQRLEEEANRVAIREMAEAIERKRLHDEEEEEGTPWADLLKEKPWKFMPRTKRMHVAPYDSIDDSAASYKFSEMRSTTGRVNEYGIYMPDSEAQYAVYYPPNGKLSDVQRRAPPTPPYQPDQESTESRSTDTTDTASMLKQNQSFEIPPYNPYQYNQVKPVMSPVHIPLPYQRDNDSSQFYHVGNENQRQSNPPNYYQVNNQPGSANQYNRAKKSSSTRNAPPPPPQARSDSQSHPESTSNYSYYEEEDNIEYSTESSSRPKPQKKQQKPVQPQQKKSAPKPKPKPESSSYAYEEDEEEEPLEEEENREYEYSNSSDSKPRPKKQPKVIEQEYPDYEEEEEEEEIVEIHNED